MHIANINHVTGIRYGYIRGDSIDPDQLHHLLYERGAKDLSWEAARDEIRKEAERMADEVEEQVSIHISEVDPNMYERDREEMEERLLEEAWDKRGFSCRDDFIDARVEAQLELIEIDEPIVEGTNDGVHWRTSWLGGALNLFIFDSPVIVKCALCSICVPNAGNLDSLGDYETYGVPVEWLAEVHHA